MSKRYSPERKTEALGIAAVRGVTEAERQTGIPKETIHYWTKTPEFARLRTTAREAMADQFWVALQVALSAVTSDLRNPDVPLRDKQQALATLYDRHALLTGGATARSENRDITGTISDAELAAAIREAESVLGAGGERATPTTEGTPEG